MAQLVGVFNTAHSPFCYLEPERWNDIRASRSLRSDVPMDDLETNRQKAKQIQHGFAVLRERLAEARPDVLVIFGDDQEECFDFTNFPAFAVYVGETFAGHVWDPDMMKRRQQGAPPLPLQPMTGHPELGVSLLTGLLKRGFDPAFCMDLPKPEEGVGHAFMHPAQSLTDLSVPVVPVLINCFYAPQPTAERCYELGRAVREIIEQHPGDLRVAVIGSGGLWHTPGGKDAYLDEAFDQEVLRRMAEGDALGMARHFDAYCVPAGDASQDFSRRGRGSAGMPSPGGPQGGTREIENWVAAAAVADGQRATVVDYIPVYASPIGVSFAFWPQL